MKRIVLKVDRALRRAMIRFAASPRNFSIEQGTARSTKISLIAAALVVVIGLPGHAAEVIPPKPAGYFNDYAGVVSKEAALRFNEQLAQFERETSDQVVVAVFPKMQSDSSIEDYTQRVAQAWGVGQKEQRNGVVLFVFKDDRKMYIQVGYGLEGALPDITAFDITEYHIKPQFRNNNYEGGLATGIDLICKAIRGEYKGSGQTDRERHRGASSPFGFLVFLLVLIVFLIASRGWRGRGYRYSSFGGPFIGGLSSGGGGWSAGGGGGGFSGISGGGGSFGGGGAGSSW
ncbi:MAG: TPM domain-containing protein [Chthoniobacterales bacterium]